jgi:hypothetical protein
MGAALEQARGKQRAKAEKMATQLIRELEGAQFPLGLTLRGDNGQKLDLEPYEAAKMWREMLMKALGSTYRKETA